MTKAELIKSVAEASGETQVTVERVLAGFQDTVVGEVAKGNEVRLAGFAAFTPVTRAARQATNPRTGEKVAVPAKNAVRIRPLGAFKTALEG